jgi:hypothetical protein
MDKEILERNKNWLEYPQRMSSGRTPKQLLHYQRIGRRVYSIFRGFGLPMKLVRLVKMCLNATYSKVHIGNHLSNKFPIQNGLKQGDALSPLLFNFALESAIKRTGKPRRD